MNRHYYRLKKRLTYNERWSENFLEIERNKEIDFIFAYQHSGLF